MRSNYSKDKFENYVKFSKLVDSNPATISRLMNAKKQTLTNKASQPKRDLVIRLAEAFDASVDEALLLAGHSPINNKIPEAINLVGFDGLDPDDLEDIADYIKFKKSQKK